MCSSSASDIPGASHASGPDRPRPPHAALFLAMDFEGKRRKTMERPSTRATQVAELLELFGLDRWTPKDCGSMNMTATATADSYS